MDTQKQQIALSNQTLRQGFWFVAIGAGLWGINPVFRVLLLDSLSSIQIVLLEHLLLLFIALPLLWFNRSDLKEIKYKHLGALLFISWGGSALATIFFTIGLTYGHLNAVLLLQKLQPLFAIILARFLLKERLPRHFSAVVFVAMFGTYLLTFGFTFPFGQTSDIFQAASLLSIAAAALWGGSTVMGRLLLKDLKYETVTALRFILAIPLLFMLVSLQNLTWALPANTSPTAVISNLVLSALLPGLFSILIYYRGLRTTKASLATLAELSFPMVALIINWFMFQEVVTIAQITGFIFIWSTLLYISSQQKTESTKRTDYKQAS